MPVLLFREVPPASTIEQRNFRKKDGEKFFCLAGIFYICILKQTHMQQTTEIPNGTSFHGETIRASVNDLKKILGTPWVIQNSGRDKTNFQWRMLTQEGKLFTVYDWKEYRPLDENEIIEWHIGGYDEADTTDALNEMASALDEI